EPLALAPLGPASSEVADVARDVDALDARYGTELEATPAWQALHGRLADPATKRAPRITDTVQLIAHVGDTSNLILDPDLDSYYRMDATVTLLPALVGQLTVIEEHAAAPNAAAQAELGAALVLVQALRGAIARSHAVAFGAN